MINNINLFQQSILTWFDQVGRKDLPWQQDISCYRVWISEIMLQQTQVKTVIPYYLNFMKQFVTISDLAAAKPDEVLHLWTGLGYYARARNLHKTAKIIVEKYQGEFPRKFSDIVELPGIGRSTAGAICAIALKQHYPILDGNVKRVLARYAAVAGAPQSVFVMQSLWQLSERLTPSERVADYTQAMMDLGSMICTRSKPACTKCPLQQDCIAYNTKTQHLYPEKKATKVMPIKNTTMLIIKNHQGETLLEKRPSIGIWGGLWLFPQCADRIEIPDWIRYHDFKILSQKELPSFRHTFSHFHLDISPIAFTVESTDQKIMDSDQFIWYNHSLKLGLAMPVKKLLASTIR